jgi:cytochrome c
VKWQIPARTLVVLLTLLPIAAYADNMVAARKETAGDFARGMHLYQACMGCHSLDENDVGPRHRGVVGRRAGTVAGYAYSGALASGLTWTRDLDRWLAGPQAFVPGTKMYYTVPRSQDRADLIAYLARQK